MHVCIAHLMQGAVERDYSGIDPYLCDGGATTGRPRIITARRDGANPSAVFSVMRSTLNSSLGVCGNALGGTMPKLGAFA